MPSTAPSTNAIANASNDSAPNGARYLVPFGRLLFAAIFLSAAPMHFAASGVALAAQQGVSMANVLVPISGALALLGGLSVLLGYRARAGALLLVLFLIPVTLFMHRFWAEGDAVHRLTQQIMFVKNVSMLGGACLLMYFGAGPFSLDAFVRSRSWTAHTSSTTPSRFIAP